MARVTHDFTGVEQARTYWRRLAGLLAGGDSLLIPDCAAIHTFFMRRPIDVVFLDDAHRVTATVEAKPWRAYAGPKGTKHTLELPAGSVRQRGIEIGHAVRTED